MTENDYILIYSQPSKFSKYPVDMFKCAHCGYRTEGKNLIEFHVAFQCKQKDVQSQ